jgi:hypothetical protein
MVRRQPVLLLSSPVAVRGIAGFDQKALLLKPDQHIQEMIIRCIS